jgi:hypothetical protein
MCGRSVSTEAAEEITFKAGSDVSSAMVKLIKVAAFAAVPTSALDSSATV